MKRSWKRILSLFLSLILILGVLPTGLKAKAAEGVDPSQDLEKANGIVWLTKNEAGDSVSDEFSSMVQTKFLLDDMVRDALGITDANTKVYFRGVDVGNVMDLLRNQEVVDSLLDEMKESISNQYLVDFTVNNTVQKIAFRNVKAAQITVGENNKIYVDHKGKPGNAQELESLITDALNHANVSVTHTGTVSATGIQTTGTKAGYVGSDFKIGNKQTYDDLISKWPTISTGISEKKAGTVSVTIYAEEYDASNPDDRFMQTVTADVILRDSDRATITIKAKAMGPSGVVADAEVDGYEYSYQAYVGDTMRTDLKPVLTNYRVTGWESELPTTVTGDATYYAIMEAKNDNNGNGIADQNEVFTIKYLDADGTQIGETLSASYGAATPEVAKPVAPEGKKYIWKLYDESTGDVFGAWQPKVSGDAIYKAVLLDGPSVAGILKFRGETSAPVELYTYLANLEANDGYKVQDPSWSVLAQDGYIPTGWYTLVPEGTAGAEDLNRDGKTEELPFSMDEDIVYTANGSVELYYEFYTMEYDDDWADGTMYNPLYIYKIEANGTVTEMESDLDKEDINEVFFPECSVEEFQKHVGWQYVQESIVGYITTYKVTPLINTYEGTIVLDSTVDTLIGSDYVFSCEVAEEGVLHCVWTKTAEDYYETYVEVSGLKAVSGTEKNYNFKYDYRTDATVSPIWKVDGSSKKIAFYVSDIRADEGSILAGYNENYEAFIQTGKYAMGSKLRVSLYVDFKPANFRMKAVADSIVAGLDSYTEEDVYNAIMDTTERSGIKFAPDYDADAMNVLYLAREKQDVEIDLYKLYELFATDGLGVLLDSVGSLPQTYNVSLSEKWMSVSETVTENTAQEVADAFITQAYEEQKNEKFANIEEFINSFLPELTKALEAQAVHAFGNTVNTDKETVKITYSGETFAAEAKTDALTVVDNRIPVYFEVKGDITTSYNKVGNKVLDNVTLYANGTAIAAEGLVSLDGENVRDYSNAEAGVYNNVAVLFKGNAVYQPAVSDTFKLTVQKVEPVVAVEEMIAVLKGTDYYEQAEAKVNPDAPIVQVVAGVAANEFKLDSNLTVVDDEIVIDAWVKLPAFYTELLDGLNLGDLNGVVDGVTLPGTTIKVGAYYEKEHLEDVLQKYLEKGDVPAADQIQQILNVFDQIPERILNRLGVNDMAYTLRIRLDALEDHVYPTAPGFYVNYAATLSTFTNMMGSVDPNYGVSEDYGFIVISPMVPVPNRGGVQLYDGQISNAQNVFVYEYNGEKIERKLSVSVNGEALTGEEPFYYGLTTRFNATKQAPTDPGVYFAGYNYTTEVYNEDSGETEVRRLGSDSAIIIIKQREVDLNIVGETYEYDGENHFADIIVTDRNGAVVNDAGVTVISGTVNVNTTVGTNVKADDLYGAVNIDFPAALQNKWDEYCNKIWGKNAPDKITPSDVIAFLTECGDAAEKATNKAVEEFEALAINDTVSAALNQINGKLGSIDISSNGLIDKAERVQHLMQGGKAYYDALIKQLEPLKDYDNNVWLTFYDLKDEADMLDYSKTGYYLYLGITTDPDVTIGAGKALVIIHSADDYIMRDTHVPYDGQPHNIFTEDNTSRGEVTVMVDRKANEIKFFLDGDMFGAVNAALKTVLGEGSVMNDGSDGYVATAYTKAENMADAVTAAIVNQIKEKAISKIENKYPAGGQLLADAMDALEGKVNALTDRVSAKLQELDKMPSDTHIVVYKKTGADDLYGMPVDAGTYEFYGYDYDVAATRGNLVIEPIYILVEDEDAWKYVNEEDPDAFNATVSYYSYSGVAPEEVEKVEITEIPAAEEDLVSYEVTREAGEEVGFYDLTVNASLTEQAAASGNYVLAEREEDGDDFEIRAYGEIKTGMATLSLIGEVYIEYMPVLEGFDGIDLTDKGGLIIWTGEGVPTTDQLVPEDTENCIVVQNMYWSEQHERWALTTTGIPAKEYGDIMYMRPFIKINNSVVYGKGVYYSPEMYCEDKLQYSPDEELRTVCAALLEYGTAAQEYFNYKTDALVNDGWNFDEYDLAYDDSMLDELHPAPAGQTPVYSGICDKVGTAQATLSLEGAVVIEVLYPEVTAENIVSAELLVWNEEDLAATNDFTYETESCTFRVPLTQGELTDEEGYVATLKKDAHERYVGIPAKECGDTVYFIAYIVTEEDGVETIYRSTRGGFSPDEYVRQKLSLSDDEKLIKVSKALAVYSEKARAYFDYKIND